jgi:hypothetical protein
MTVDEVIAAVHKTGFRIVSDGKGGGTLTRPNGQGHVPSRLMTELKRVKAELVEKWDQCSQCKCGYSFLHRADVAKLCERGNCPVRSIT